MLVCEDAGDVASTVVGFECGGFEVVFVDFFGCEGDDACCDASVSGDGADDSVVKVEDGVYRGAVCAPCFGDVVEGYVCGVCVVEGGLKV